MIAQSSRPSTSLRRLYPLFFAALGLSLVIGTLLPRAMAFLPGILGLGFYAYSTLHPALRIPPVKQKLWLFPLVVLLLALTSALWALSPEEVLSRTGKLVPILIPGTFFILCCRTISFESIKKYAAPLIGGALLASVILMNIEYRFDYPLYRMFRGIEYGDRVKPHELNRSVIVITALLFPVITLITTAFNKTRYLVAGIYLLAYTPLLFLTDSQSAILAFTGGLFFFLAFPFEKKWAWHILSGLTIAAFLAMPFLSIWAFKNFATQIDTINAVRQANIANRLEIWDYVSRYMLQKPLTGFGIEASRVIEDFDSAEVYQKGTSILHPHNAFIQIWLEFGIFGVMVISALFITLLRWLSQLPAAAQRACLPGMICLLSVSLTGYGLWQSWWVGLFLFFAGISTLSVIAATQTDADGDTK